MTAGPTRMLVSAALLVLACAGAPPARAPAAAAPGAADVAPPCAPGALVFSASQAPRGVAVSRDGAMVAVADRGALVLRDAGTLAPIRYLLPMLDHWRRVWFARDGRLRAETIDGLRFRIDVGSGKVERLLNDESQAPKQALLDDEVELMQLYLGRAEAMKKHERGFWEHPPLRWRYPALPTGVEGRGIALGVLARVGGATRLEAIAEIEATEDGDHARLFVAGSDGKLRAYDMDGKLLAEGAVPAGDEVVRLDVGGDRVLAALSDGGAAIFDRALTLERRVRVLENPHTPPAFDPRGRADVVLRGGPKAWPPHGLRGLDYDPARGRLMWVSTSHELGVTDVATGKPLRVLPGTAGLAGVQQMAFVGTRHVAAAAGGRLWVWDPYTGARAMRGDDYRALAPLGGPRLLASRRNGDADVVEIAVEKPNIELRVARTLCLRADGDCSEKLPFDEHTGRPRRPPKVELATSPDGRRIAVFEWPVPDRSGEGHDRAGRLAVLSADSLAVARSVALRDCEHDAPLELGAREILACGRRHDAATLAALPAALEMSTTAGVPKPENDPLFDVLGPGYQRVALGAGAIGIGRMGDGYESIAVVDATGELVGMLGNVEASNPERTRVFNRAQLRRESMIVASADGSRFLIAGSGTAGALQLWCTPADGVAGFPHEPPRPDVLEVDGVTEVAVAGFPAQVIDAIEVQGGVLILGTGPRAVTVAPPARELWLFDPAARRLEPVAPPAVSDGALEWERFDTDPGGGGVWLVGKRHVARRAAGGAWTVWSLPPGTTNQVAPISADVVVHVAIRPCIGAKMCPGSGAPLCFAVSLIGALPPSANANRREINACVGALAPFPGGFVALGGAELGFRGGKWLAPRDRLASTAASAHAREGFGRGGELFLTVDDGARVAVFDLADGRRRRTLELPFAGRVSPISASPGHGPALWVESGMGERSVVDIDADAGGAGKASVRGGAVIPAWMGVERTRARGGKLALWWVGGSGLVVLEDRAWTAYFDPNERTKSLVARRGR